MVSILVLLSRDFLVGSQLRRIKRDRKEQLGWRRQLLRVNVSSKRLDDWRSPVDLGQQVGHLDFEHGSQPDEMEIGHVDGAAFDFGNATAADTPTGLLQNVGQFVLGPVALVAQAANLSGNQIRSFHTTFSLFRSMSLTVHVGSWPAGGRFRAFAPSRFSEWECRQL